MTKEMLWLLMGHLVCIGQWAAFIMVDHAFLGRGRRFRFPCLWAALLAAVFLAASIRHDIGFFNVESVILNVIYLLVTVLFFRRKLEPEALGLPCQRHYVPADGKHGQLHLCLV